MNGRDSTLKMLSLALRQSGVGLLIFALANIAPAHIPEMGLRALGGVTLFAYGAILERRRKS